MSDLAMVVYNLDLLDAIKKVMDGEGWAQGQNFRDGVVIMGPKTNDVTRLDYGLHLHHFGDTNPRTRKLHYQISKRAFSQKYRIITSQAEAMRK